MLQGLPLLVCKYFWGKKCLHRSYQTNMILYKSTHCPFLPHYVKSCYCYKKDEMLDTHNLI